MNGEVADIVEASPATYDELFDVLADERRRRALYCLDTRGRSAGLAELADGVARLEHGVDGRDSARLPVGDVRHVYLQLYHVHVPKMKDAGIVEYDRNSGTVRMHPALEGFDFEATLSAIHG